LFSAQIVLSTGQRQERESWACRERPLLGHAGARQPRLRGADRQRAVNWTFAPGNSSGAEPYGRYAARRLFVSPHWKGPAASSVTRPGSMDIGCAMTAGDSGGPWLTGFSPQTGAGTVAAVTAYKLSGDLRTLYGTVLGPTARALYLRASA
jgi:hypothetical protein